MVDLLVQAGSLLLQHGADASRVEASLEQMEPGLGIDRIDAVVMSKTILLTATRQDAHHTRVARVPIVGVNMNILSEVERTAHSVTIIREGRTVESGVLDRMRHLHRSRLSATLTGTVPDLTGVSGVHDLVVDGRSVDCSVEPESLSAVLSALAAAGIETLSSNPPSLEELFLDAYRNGAGVSDGR